MVEENGLPTFSGLPQEGVGFDKGPRSVEGKQCHQSWELVGSTQTVI